MNRYFLFAYDDYESSGGFNDFINDFKHYSEIKPYIINKFKSYSFTWYQIVDTEKLGGYGIELYESGEIFNN